MAKLEIFYNSACPVRAVPGIEQHSASAWRTSAVMPPGKTSPPTTIWSARSALISTRCATAFMSATRPVQVHVGADAIARLDARKRPARDGWRSLMMAAAAGPSARWLYDRFADQLFAWNRAATAGGRGP